MSAKSRIEERLRAIGRPEDDDSQDPNEPLVKKWDRSLKKFSNVIEKYYNDNRQSNEEFDKKMGILEEIEGYLTEHVFNKPISGIQYEIKAVVPFGSSASGLGMKEGDLDMTICVYPPLGKRRKDEIKERSNEILSKIYKKIKSGKMLRGRKMEDMCHIDGARVPIITGNVDGIDLDISISMTFVVSAQYLASKFIDAYEKYNRKFILLAAYVKYWFKSKKTDENEDYYRTVFPNSCTNVLLVIFFMKQLGLLPDVHNKHKDRLGENRSTWERVNGGENGSYGVPDADVKRWRDSNYCEVSVGTLFLLFLDFYANLDFQTYKISIGKGALIPKGRRRRTRVVIEDVIDKENMGRCIIQTAMFKKYLNEGKKIIQQTDPTLIEKKLMKGPPLPNVMKYSKSEMKALREEGLHYGQQPKKFIRPDPSKWSNL